MSRTGHWDGVWSDRTPDAVSWYQDEPRTSVAMVDASGAPADARLVDVGGGASTLVDRLLAKGHTALTVFDIAPQALERARQRLGPRADHVQWLTGDVTDGVPDGPYVVWHDRAVLHFLTEPDDQAAYARSLDAALAPDGQAIVATFAPDGPTTCSGLTVQRHDAKSIGAILGDGFELVEEMRESHRTPWDGEQSFVFARFKRA